MDCGSVEEDVAAPFVCSDKSEAPVREPSVNASISEIAG